MALFVNAFRERFVKSREFQQAVRAAVGEPGGGVTLGPSWTASWMDPPLADWAKELEPMGFRRIGAYGIPEWNGLEVYPMYSDQLTAFIFLYRIPRTENAWFEISSPTASGQRIVVSSSPIIGAIPKSAGVIRQNLWNVKPSVAVGVFVRERQRLGQGHAPLSESDFETYFTQMAMS